jgi:hypothetical protein
VTRTWTDPNSLATYIWLFNVGRGLSALIRTPLGHGIMVDLGSSTDFSPSEFTSENIVPHLGEYETERGKYKIAQLVISHPHYDHFSDLGAYQECGLTEKTHLVTCPHDKQPQKPEEGPDERVDFDRIVNPDGTEEAVMGYHNLYAERNLPLQTISFAASRTVPNLEYGLYYLNPKTAAAEIYPEDSAGGNQKYGNATSLMLYYRYGANSILFPGDMPPEAMTWILDELPGTGKRMSVLDSRNTLQHPDWALSTGNQPALRSLLQERGLTVLVAPHHGLESCYSEDLIGAVKGGKPDIVLISEKAHTSPTDGSVDARYKGQDAANGLYISIDGRDELAYSHSTAQGHHMLVVFDTSPTPRIYASNDPEALLEY